MPPSDDQLAFLKTCMKHGNFTAAQIPWEKVVEELGLPSVGAAQKRWSRMMQAHNEGTTKGGAADGAADNKKKPKAKATKVTKPKTTKAAAGGKGGSKKRKVEEEEEEDEEAADFKDEDSEA
ncbi:hypothetical protein Micbo1qcDRAFT_170746 [Microdochium bolleyi]|uniref:Myb-like DNA-binding domain-containing protein n=1 Tax=Microdochium bolleyi TaxID=196109 RepID=A0A136JIQ1_9PEZI|nr:hypothetical protein Micbo1qcDRAFT_170746 [Microdochium bolleyi]